MGNSFPGASNRWVQNFFIHTNVHPNSLGTRDKVGRLWKLHVDYTDPAHQEWEFVPKGITAFKRSSGEYLIFVEENYKAKSLIYRWMP